MTNEEKALLGLFLYVGHDKPFADRKIAYAYLPYIDYLPEELWVNVKEPLFHCRYNMSGKAAIKAILEAETYQNQSGVYSCTKRGNVYKFLDNAVALPEFGISASVIVFEASVKRAISLRHFRKYAKSILGDLGAAELKPFLEFVKDPHKELILFNSIMYFIKGKRNCGMAQRLHIEKEYLIPGYEHQFTRATLYNTKDKLKEDFS